MSGAPWIGLTAAVALWVAAAPARAQSPASRIIGVAVAENGERVVGAQVRVIELPGQPAVTRAITSESGAFLLAVAGDTAPRLIVRRIGFRPETLTVRLPQPATPQLIVRLARVIQMVNPVLVTAEAAEPNEELAAMRDRQRTGGTGYFLYRDEFMKHEPARFSDILRRIPGVQMSRSNRTYMDIRLRGSRCPPLYWIDGQPLLGIPFDPDMLPPQDIEAIEVYSGAGLVPSRFLGPPRAQGCGAIVIWTRRGERAVRPPKIDADSIARLLDAHRIFVASEVDTPAVMTAMPEPDYPDSLRVAGVGGSAVIEFIVERDGTLNKRSIGIVSATHVEFADALRLAVLDATFTPAVKAQRPVAQVYQLPVRFTPPPRP